MFVLQKAVLSPLYVLDNILIRTVAFLLHIRTGILGFAVSVRRLLNPKHDFRPVVFDAFPFRGRVAWAGSRTPLRLFGRSQWNFRGRMG